MICLNIKLHIDEIISAFDQRFTSRSAHRRDYTDLQKKKNPASEFELLFARWKHISICLLHRFLRFSWASVGKVANFIGFSSLRKVERVRKRDFCVSLDPISNKFLIDSMRCANCIDSFYNFATANRVILLSQTKQIVFLDWNSLLEFNSRLLKRVLMLNLKI